ncbi:unnamed protein product [Phytophthora lilii]|uniref:Unnamed protein product n=1 Tax=Phytophthora lilii TaxID=2077276 RepID=A0A9W7D8V7_9STRA|nr:unnamed protein product [Phytophthora lilii]
MMATEDGYVASSDSAYEGEEFHDQAQSQSEGYIALASSRYSNKPLILWTVTPCISLKSFTTPQELTPR